MRLFVLFILFVSCADLFTEESQFEPFTGKVLKNRVRMRLQPSLNSYVFRELNKDDLVLVAGQAEDFYACMPPKELKAYIFRTFVLDGVVEGSNVNVRLEPDVSAPVITQLHTGDRVQGGVIASQNTKWLQIEMPEGVRFYVAKELIDKAGSTTLFAERQERLQKVQHELDSISTALDSELQKPFDQVKLSPIVSQLGRIIDENRDLPREVERAEALKATMQEKYLAKGLTDNLNIPQIVLHQETPQTVTAEQEAEPEPVVEISPVIPSSFQEREELLIQDAMKKGWISSPEQFYASELKEAKTLKGIIKPYQSLAKHVPGNFLLIDEKSEHPIALLYSTKANLNEYNSRLVTLKLAHRPNNHFALPAYFVLQVDECH